MLICRIDLRRAAYNPSGFHDCIYFHLSHARLLQTVLLGLLVFLKAGKRVIYFRLRISHE
ncbi:hypothetical protein K431DRAFT_283039 [Polychaeton citri CBS 116435]|uniref:Uncharacterized protein n=1 Tax=Polychaeton citri CBS 116435 TaxID=1314669 RepID=A0A9P4QE18_9PEZI|nr:hypothetical protein K431DRAFT_283039 [Polychaeton citri CBS 116435]